MHIQGLHESTRAFDRADRFRWGRSASSSKKCIEVAQDRSSSLAVAVQQLTTCGMLEGTSLETMYIDQCTIRIS